MIETEHKKSVKYFATFSALIENKLAFLLLLFGVVANCSYVVSACAGEIDHVSCVTGATGNAANASSPERPSNTTSDAEAPKKRTALDPSAPRGNETSATSHNPSDGAQANEQLFYRLKGLDNRWIALPDNNATHDVALRPGSYRFEIESRSADARTTVASAYFVVPFLSIRKLSNAAAVIFLALLTLWVFHYLRVEALRAHAAVVDERQRIAGEIHDTLAQNFAAISIQLDAAMHEIDQSRTLPIKNIMVAREVAAASVLEARKSLWDLESSEVGDESLVSSVRIACEGKAFDRNAAPIVSSSGRPWKVNARAESHLIRIAQQAAANALEHGQATEVRVSINFSLCRLRMEISDNGRGFSESLKDQPLRGFGLTQMRRRAQACGGRLAISNPSGKGAHVIVDIARRKLRGSFAYASTKGRE